MSGTTLREAIAIRNRRIIACVHRDESRAWFVAAAVAVLTCAAALRIADLGHSLFEDEVWVATLVRHGGLRPHTYATPPLFYCLMRGWAFVRGTSDVALREPAATFGVILCALPFFAPLPRMTRLLWSVLLAFSSPLLYYSDRVKQYTLEGCAVTLLLILFMRASEDDSRRLWIAFFSVAVVAVALLHTPIFVMVAAGGASLLRKRTRRPAILFGFAVIAAVWASAYFLFVAPGPETARVHGDMDAWFELTGRWVDSPRSLITNSTFWLGHALNLTRGGIACLLAVIVFWTVRERDWHTLTLALVPPAIAAAASTVHAYPYGEVRLMIYCFPGLYLIISRSVELLTRTRTLAALLIVPFVIAGVGNSPYPSTYMRTPDLRVIYTAVARSQPDEIIIADPSYAAPLLYYHPQLRDRTRVATVPDASSAGWYLQTASRFRSRGSVVIEQGGVVATKVP